MKYYLGTKTQCEAYDADVTEGENYRDGTVNWASPRKTSELGVYAIQKHDKHEPNDDMELLDESDFNWLETNEKPT